MGFHIRYNFDPNNPKKTAENRWKAEFFTFGGAFLFMFILGWLCYYITTIIKSFNNIHSEFLINSTCFLIVTFLFCLIYLRKFTNEKSIFLLSSLYSLCVIPFTTTILGIALIINSNFIGIILLLFSIICTLILLLLIYKQHLKKQNRNTHLFTTKNAPNHIHKNTSATTSNICFCHKCGKKLLQNSAFCSYCGTTISTNIE